MAAAQSRTFGGTFLTPGVSLNDRLYTKAMISKAVVRMQERIADPDGLPIVMRTHHQANDNSRLIVGRVTAARQAPDGSGTFEARWYDTEPARDIAALVQPADGGPPGLRSVSIHGFFLGPKTIEFNGQQVETADDLIVDAIDFTATPGVVKALISGESRAFESTASCDDVVPISETWEAPVADTAVVTEQIPAEPAAPGAWTDLTEQVAGVVTIERGDAAEAYSAAQKRDMVTKGQAIPNAKGSPSYPVKTKTDLRKAIRAVGRGGADHDDIRAHLIARAKAMGLMSMIPDNWNADGSLKESADLHARYAIDTVEALRKAVARARW